MTQYRDWFKPTQIKLAVNACGESEGISGGFGPWAAAFLLPPWLPASSGPSAVLGPGNVSNRS